MFPIGSAGPQSARANIYAPAYPDATLRFFFSSKRLYDIHINDLTDFYVETGTAHRIKINDHSYFHSLNTKTKKTKIFGSKGALRSLHILHIGRIGSEFTNSSLRCDCLSYSIQHSNCMSHSVTSQDDKMLCKIIKCS